MMNRLLLMMTGLGLIFSTSHAQSQKRVATLNLQLGTFEVPVDSDGKLTQADIAGWQTVQGRKVGVVALEQWPSKQEQRSMKEDGVEILGFLPERFYLVAVNAGANLGVISSVGINQAGSYLDEYKWVADPVAIPSRAAMGNNQVAIVVRGFKGFSLERLASDLQALENIEIREVNDVFDYIEIAINEETLPEVAAIESVETIEWRYPDGEPENHTSRTLSRTRFLSYDNNSGLNYDGSGVSVAVQDNGAIGPHIDFHGRIAAQFTAADEGDHGDHCSGTVTGAGNLNPRHQGQAEGADLYIYKAWPEYNGIGSIDSHYYNYNIYITSTSYSDGCNAGYTARTRTVDQQAYNLDRLIHVYSAGNSGTSNCGYGAGSNWGNITGGHKMGKNVITVGNVTLTDGLATSSSRGPAHDGRIKPDICAQGTQVTSTIAGNTYDTYTGTSMACPNIAGSLILLYEAFEDHHGEQPDGGLMKAIVLNTAEDLGNTGPDFKHGWGRINGRRAYKVISESTFLKDSLSSGNNEHIHQISVPSGVKRLRVMVYWTDPAASIGASTALVNDLDLLGFTPSLDTLRPYVLDPTPNITTLNLPAQPGEDHLNNMEQIEVFDPVAGTYSFTISPYSVPVGPQEYFLVYYMEEDPLTLTYPIGGEPFVPFTNEVIRWDSELEGNLSIDYSIDGGSTWSSATSSVPAAQGYYSWYVPFLNEGDVKVRLVHDSASVQSEIFSVMTVPENIQIMYACPDSIGLMWNPIGAALSYDVYKLGDKYMDSIGTSTTVEFVDYTSNPYSDMLWYAVSSDGPDAAKSMRSIAVKKTPGLQNCFLGNDLNALMVLPDVSVLTACHGGEINVSFLVENNGVTPSSAFQASLIGPNGVIASDSFTTSIAPLSIDTFDFTTPVSLSTGLNAYHLVLDMPGDQNHYNDTAEKYYLVDTAAALLPLWEEHFDQMNFTCSDEANCGATTCELPEGWMNVENELFDDIDWRLYDGTTPSSFTGPLGDNSTPGAQGKYVYLEASGDCAFQEARLVSPCIDLSNASGAMLTFYYSMYGVDMGELHVDVYDGSDWNLDVMTPLSGNQGSDWRFAEVDLSAFNGMNINVRFRGIIGDDYRSDMALDDISIIHLPVANFEYFTQVNGQTVLFNDLGEYADSMSFDVGDGTSLFDTVPASHDYNQQIAYSVTQIVSNPFGMDTMSVDIVNLGADDQASFEAAIYPNPANTNMTIEVDQQGVIDKVDLWSVDGRLISSTSMRSVSLTTLNVSDLSAGAYVIKIHSGHVYEYPIMIAH